MTTVTGFPRLHAGLFDLGTATPRKYGGIGFVIAGPPTVVTAEPAQRQEIRGVETLDAAGRDDLDAALARLAAQYDVPAVSVTIGTIPPQHVGLGSKTSLVLTMLQAVSEALALALPPREIQALSGRGGTSGIGVHAFFGGGLLIDGGHRSNAPRTYGPSSLGPPAAIPPLLLHLMMPSDWRVALLLADGAMRSGADEAAAFNEMTPVPDVEVQETISLAVMGLAASAAEGDLSTFAACLASMQRTGFKGREVSAQPAAVQELLGDLLQVPRCAAGMSSMGPLLFAISASNDSDCQRQIVNVVERHQASLLDVVSFRNKGFVVG